MRLFFLFFILIPTISFTQDTTVVDDKRVVTLPEVFVRKNFDHKKLIQQIINDTTFYKAFRNLRVLGYTSYNDIKMMDKKGNTKATLNSKTKQIRVGGCRTTDILEEVATGDFYTDNHEYNYLTAEMYAGLFFSKGKVCGEDNIVTGHSLDASNKTGMAKHKEQLKMLFFNPGKKYRVFLLLVIILIYMMKMLLSITIIKLILLSIMDRIATRLLLNPRRT